MNERFFLLIICAIVSLSFILYGIAEAVTVKDISKQPTTTRYSDYNLTDNQDGTFVRVLGLTPRLPDGSGHYNQDYYFYNNTKTYTIATGLGTYVYVVANCGLKLFTPTQDTNGQTPLINSISYTIRDSPYQNFSSSILEKGLTATCSTPSFIDTGKHLQINGTKQNGNVTVIISYTLDAGQPLKTSYYLIPKIKNQYWRVTESQTALPPIVQTFKSLFIANSTSLPSMTTKDFLVSDLKNPDPTAQQSQISFIDKNGRIIIYDYQKSIDMLSRTGLSFNLTSGKVNLFNDYQSRNTLGIGELLSIDPQIYVPTFFFHHVISTSDTSGVCPVSGGAVQLNFASALYSGANNVNDHCDASTFRFDTTWATNALVTKTELVYAISGTPLNAKNCDFVSIANDPATASTQQQWDDIRSSPTTYVSNSNTCTTVATGKIIDLGANANTDFINSVNAGWFAVGIKHNPFTKGDASVHHQDLSSTSTTYLRVTYTLVYPPTVPQSFTTTAGKNQVSLAWSAPSDNGGNAISKYYIARSISNRLFQEQLPDNGDKDDFSSNHPVNMIGNTLLLHFDDKNATTLVDTSPYSGQNTILTGNTIFNSDDYETKGDSWTTIGTLVTYNDVVNGFAQNGYFNVATDGSDKRIYKSLSSSLPSSGFHLLLDFSPSAQATADHYIMVLSNNTNNPDTTAKQNTILVAYTSGALKACTSFNTSVKTCSGTITATVGSTYFLKVDRTSTTSITLHVYSDTGRTIEIAGSPVTLTVDSRTTDLNTIQHSVRSSQAAGNTLTATLDNLVIYTSTPSHLDSYRQTGLFNQAILFDGTYDYVNVTSTKIPVKNNNDFTVGFWVKQRGFNIYPNTGTPIIIPLSFKKTSISQTLFEVNSSHAFISSDGIPIITSELVPSIFPINENFSAQHGWTTVGSGTDISGGHLNLNTAGTSGRTYKALAYTLSSNDLWSINFDLHAATCNTAYTVTSMAQGGVGDTLGDAVNTIGIKEINQNPNIQLQPYYKITGSTTKNVGVGNYILSNGVTYFVTFQKESPTVVRLYVYTDAARTVLLDTPETFIVPLTVNGFNSFIGGDMEALGCGFTNWIDNLKMTYNLQAWHQFTFTRNSNTWKIFEDGTQIGNNITSATNIGSPINNAFIIGANATGTGGFHAGYFDDYFIQNRTMTSNEINSIYFRGTGTYPVLFSTAGTSYTDIGLTNGQQYFYRIFANNAYLNGTYTSYKNATVFTIPSAPLSLSANRISISQVDLSWTQPASNGGTAIGGYYILRQNGTDQTYYEEPYNSHLKSYWKFDGNLNYTDYATNKSNLTLTIGTPNFTSSQIFQGFNYNGGYHTAPLESKYDYDYNTPFSISHWIKSNTASTMMIVAKGGTTGLDKDGFQDYVQSNGRPTFVLADPSGTHLIKVEYNFNALNGKPQQIIWAYDGTGIAAGVHLYINGTQQALIIDSDNLASNSIQNNKQLTIAARDGGSSKFIGVIDDLRILSTNLTTTQASILASFTTSSTTTFSDTVATMTSVGKYKVYAVNQVGAGPASNVVTVGNIPANPTSLTATAISGSQVRLNWIAPNDNGGTAITGYKYQINGSGTTTIGNVTTYVVSGLPALHTETFRVKATNAQGDSGYSNNATAITQENMVGTNNINYTITGNVIAITPRILMSQGIPFANATKLELVNGTTIIQTINIHVLLPKGNMTIPRIVYQNFNHTSNFYINATVTNQTTSIILKSNSTGPVNIAYTPSFISNNGFTFNYTFIRTASNTNLNLGVNRLPAPFNMECRFFTGPFDAGVWRNTTQGGAYNVNVPVSPSLNEYGTCYGSGQIFSFTSFGAANGQTLFLQITNAFGSSFFGIKGSAGFILFGLIIFASIFTGRTASTGIIIFVAVLGVIGAMGFLPILSPLVWIGIVVMACLGALAGKKYF